MDIRNQPASRLARRTFIELIGKSAVVIVFGGLIRFLEPQWFRLYRPPGAVVEEEFLSRCIRCDRCRKACPWDLIAPVPLTEGLINAGTPILKGNCRHCWLCIPVCPTGALRN